MSKKILITGGSGLIGIRLSRELSKKGHEVIHLSRSRNKNADFKSFTWDLVAGKIEEGALENVDSIIHLAGAGVADKRWSESRKRELVSSRVDSANLIYEHLKASGRKIDAFISSSAIGIYGFDTGGILQTEDRIQLGDDFLATLTKKWESAAEQFTDLDARVVKLRIGLVLSATGGLLSKFVPFAKWGLSSAFGSGEQYMSWIHIDDLVNMFVEAVENSEFKGTYNAVSPNPVTNKSFLQQLNLTLGKPFFLPNTPKFMLKLGLGELASAVTGGNRVSSQKIVEHGFNFNYSKLDDALQDLLIN